MSGKKYCRRYSIASPASCLASQFKFVIDTIFKYNAERSEVNERHPTLKALRKNLVRNDAVLGDKAFVVQHFKETQKEN